MQAGKNAMASVKETASNIAASAKSGMEKTKATLEEKVEKMTAHHPAEKEMAEEKKQDKIREAEIAKRETKEQNAAAREQARAGHTGGPITTAHPSAAAAGHHTTGAPGQVAGDPTGGHVISGTVESHPIGKETGTARPATAHNPYAGTANPAGRGTGGGYD
ncbi:late embryogenesis abundant protein 46 [Elaeis guineensis]|uniref:11 kDa late embryogenesis abundant protein n=1 Tax=Elaeis guineensis var. tenera TaxID=51953 RepID=A0A6I9RMH5_ELAGV|nr:11 kDa late embryogenesis abundant protein [Elaeis guineensis]